MEYCVCHVCKHFRQYYKYVDCKLVEAQRGECKLFPFYSCERPTCQMFEVWEVNEKSLVKDVLPYVKNINDSIEFLKQLEQKIEEKNKNSN